MDQYLLIPFLGGWTSINPSYFDVNKKGVQGFDTLPDVGNTEMLDECEFLENMVCCSVFLVTLLWIKSAIYHDLPVFPVEFWMILRRKDGLKDEGCSRNMGLCPKKHISSQEEGGIGGNPKRPHSCRVVWCGLSFCVLQPNLGKSDWWNAS